MFASSEKIWGKNESDTITARECSAKKWTWRGKRNNKHVGRRSEVL